MRAPNLFICNHGFAQSLIRNTTSYDDKGDLKFVPARPLSVTTLHQRVRIAWLVLTGKADALIWLEDDE